MWANMNRLDLSQYKAIVETQIQSFVMALQQTQRPSAEICIRWWGEAY